jgi:hypothetical protein
MVAAKDGSSSLRFGEGLQQTLAKRGIQISLEKAARLSRALLDLAEHDLLVPVEEQPYDGTRGNAS